MRKEEEEKGRGKTGSRRRRRIGSHSVTASYGTKASTIVLGGTVVHRLKVTMYLFRTAYFFFFYSTLGYVPPVKERALAGYSPWWGLLGVSLPPPGNRGAIPHVAAPRHRLLGVALHVWPVPFFSLSFDRQHRVSQQSSQQYQGPLDGAAAPCRASVSTSSRSGRRLQRRMHVNRLK